MKKNTLITAFVFVLIIAFTYCIYQNDVQMNQEMKLTQIEAEQEQLKMRMLQHIEAIEGHIPGNTPLYSLQNQDSILDDLVRKGPRVGLFIDRSQCESCWERALNYLKKVSPTIHHMPKPFILVSGYNRRDFMLLNRRHKIPYPIYLIDRPTGINHLCGENQPFYFILEAEGRLTSVFYPEELYSSMGEFYFNAVAKICYQVPKTTQATDSVSSITLLNPTVNLGNVARRKKRELNLLIKNNDSKKCQVKDVSVSCNCVLLEFTPEIILPGETERIKAVFLSTTKGPFVREIQFRTNLSSSTYRFKIHGTVI